MNLKVKAFCFVKKPLIDKIMGVCLSYILFPPLEDRAEIRKNMVGFLEYMKKTSSDINWSLVMHALHLKPRAFVQKEYQFEN